MSATDGIDMLLSCANCGKGEEESNKLKKCSACLSVKYCSAACQKAHRPQHKKACKKRAAELHKLLSILYDEKLFKEVDPDECPICMLPLPFMNSETIISSCCGKTICIGCAYTMNMSEGKDLCAFCRTPAATSAKEEIKRVKKLMGKGYAGAFLLLAGAYANGNMGLPQDYRKCNELNLKAGELGRASAYHNLGVAYEEGRGVERDEKKAKDYYELAAMSGCVTAIACIEWNVGNYDRGMRHFMIAARAGHKESLDRVKEGYINGMVTKDHYANTLRAHHEKQKEMKSDARDKAKAHGNYRIVG